EEMMNDRQHYGRSFLMALLSRVSMYVLMYAMVDRWANVFSNVNQFYMAGLMAAPMIIIEIAVMSGNVPESDVEPGDSRRQCRRGPRLLRSHPAADGGGRSAVFC